jgi:hypothetical protein
MTLSQITENGVSGPAHFLFASEDGTISAWNPQVDQRGFGPKLQLREEQTVVANGGIVGSMTLAVFATLPPHSHIAPALPSIHQSLSRSCGLPVET